jgi:seryl-tRNA synthetase
MKSPGSLLIAAAALMALPISVFCSQQSTQNKRPVPTPVPTMTSDDVIASRPAPTTDSASADQPKTGDQTAEAGGKPAAEEVAWRHGVKQARKQADSTKRAAEETELRITDLRNQLGASGQGAGDRNQTMADLAAMGDKLKQQKVEAREAADALKKLLDEGREKGYREEEGPAAVSKGGEANEDYYRSKFTELNQAAQDADRRVQLYQNRVNELNQRIGGNSRTGDNFFIGQLQQERDDAQRSLDEARAAYQKAQADIDALKDSARAAGLPPGIFR